MRFVRAPDFPTGGIICGTAGIRKAYEVGRGRVIISFAIHQEERKNGGISLVVTEIPYGIKLGPSSNRLPRLIAMATSRALRRCMAARSRAFALS